MGWFSRFTSKSGPSGSAASGSAQSRTPTSGGAGTPRRGYTIHLSFSGMITTVIIAIISLGWMFAFGVIVGRGYNPEQQLTELARLMPAVPGAENATEAATNTILKPEELTFMNDLRQRPGVDGLPAQGPAAPAGASPTSASAAAGTAQGAGGKNTAPPVAPPPPADRNVYDFVFQVVAYKNSSQADSLRERLEQDGLRTRMTIEKDANGRAKWYRVQVIVRGNEDEAAAVKTRLGKLGLKDPTIASKKPAARNR